MILEQGGNFEKPDTGSFVGVIADVVELYNVKSTFQGQVRETNKVRIVWVLDKNDSTGKPYHVILQVNTISCIGYDGHVCGKVVEARTSRKRCLSCAAKWRSAQSDRLNPQRARERHHKWNRINAELMSVRSHHSCIFNPKNRRYCNYQGMSFFDAWNPDKGGSFKVGADWIITNLGKKSEGCSLHIVDHELGFVPGNLEWATPKKQSNQQMFKIIADQRHKIRQLKEEIQELELKLAA